MGTVPELVPDTPPDVDPSMVRRTPQVWESAVSRRGALEEERRVLEERLWPAGGRSGRWRGLTGREIISHCTVANPVGYTVAYSIPHTEMLSCAACSCSRSCTVANCFCRLAFKRIKLFFLNSRKVELATVHPRDAANAAYDNIFASGDE